MLALLGQANGSWGLPQGKAIAMILFFGAIMLTSLVGIFASSQSLKSMAGIIGTKNPRVARMVCGLGFVVGLVAVFATLLSLLGEL